jgi:hypothetical protein
MALRRLPFVVAVVVGAALLGIGFTKSSVDAGRAGDELVEASAPTLSDAGLRRLRTEFDDLVATGHAFRDAGIPRLAELSAEDVATFKAGLRASAPAVLTGFERLPAIEKQADAIVTNLTKRQHQFESAEALPGLGLSLAQGAVGGLVLGGALVGLGVLGLWRPRRGLAAGLAVLGALLIAGPLLLGYPGKTADTDALLDSLRPFTVAKVEARESSLATVEALLTGLQDKVIPATAVAAGLSPEQLAADLANADPRLSPAAQARADEAMAHFTALVKFSGTIQPLLVQTSELPARATTWMLLLPGVALLLSGTVATAALSRK